MTFNVPFRANTNLMFSEAPGRGPYTVHGPAELAIIFGARHARDARLRLGALLYASCGTPLLLKRADPDWHGVELCTNVEPDTIWRNAEITAASGEGANTWIASYPGTLLAEVRARSPERAWERLHHVLTSETHTLVFRSPDDDVDPHAALPSGIVDWWIATPTVPIARG